MLRLHAQHIFALQCACDSWLDIQPAIKDGIVSSLNNAVEKQEFDRIATLTAEFSEMSNDIANMTALQVWVKQISETLVNNRPPSMEIQVTDGLLRRVRFPIERALTHYVELNIEGVTDPLPPMPDDGTLLPVSKELLSDITIRVQENVYTIAAAVEMLTIVRERYIR